MQKVFDALMANGTWKPVPCLDTNDPIGRKLFYRKKLK